MRFVARPDPFATDRRESGDFRSGRLRARLHCRVVESRTAGGPGRTANDKAGAKASSSGEMKA